MTYEPLEGPDLEGIAAAARDFARGVRAMYVGLIEQGFTDAQAMSLVGNWIEAQA